MSGIFVLVALPGFVGLGVLGLFAAIALGMTSLPLLLVAATLAGLGQGIIFRTGLTLFNEQAPADRRSEVASTFFTVMYAGISIPVVGVGLGAGAWGLRTAGIGFCLTMAALSLAPLLLPRPSSGIPTRHETA